MSEMFYAREPLFTSNVIDLEKFISVIIGAIN